MDSKHILVEWLRSKEVIKRGRWWALQAYSKGEKFCAKLMHRFGFNRPFPSWSKPLFQSETKCKAIDMKMIIFSHANKTNFHVKGFALTLVLKVRVFGTRPLRNGLFDWIPDEVNYSHTLEKKKVVRDSDWTYNFFHHVWKHHSFLRLAKAHLRRNLRHSFSCSEYLSIGTNRCMRAWRASHFPTDDPFQSVLCLVSIRAQ